MATHPEGPVLVTDQLARTGIGDYAGKLYQLLAPSLPRLRGVSLQYLSGTAPKGFERPSGARLAQSWVEVPSVLRHNREIARREWAAGGPVCHQLGSHYDELTDWSKTLVTVNDYYARKPEWRMLSNRDILLREALTEWARIASRRTLRRVRAVVVYSRHVARQVADQLGVQATVIPLWIDREMFRARDRDACRATLGLPTGRPIVLNVGAGTLNKNHSLMRKVVNMLPAHYLFVKVGARLDGIGEGHRQVGSVPEASYPLYFCAADAYLHTSTEEGFGYPLLESLASGLPVVALDRATAGEVLGKDGTLVAPSAAPAEFAEALASAIETEYRRKVFPSLISRADIFSADVARQQYLDLYSRTFGP